MERHRLVTALALAWALIAAIFTVTLALKVLSLKEELEGIRRDLEALQGTVNTASGRVSYVRFCVETRQSVRCFDSTPVYGGEPALLVASAYSDLTVGFRNNTFTIVSATVQPECRKWVLEEVGFNSTTRVVSPLDPVFGGETLILKCDG